MYNDVAFTCNVVPCHKKGTKSEYELELLVYVIDPATGNRFQDEVRRSKYLEKHPEMNLGEDGNVRKKSFDVFISKYLKNGKVSDKDIKTYARDMAKTLYYKYETDLLRRMNETVKIGDVTPKQLYTRYYDGFFKSQYARLAPGTLENYKSILKEACHKLDNSSPVQMIKEKAIKELFEIKKFRDHKVLIGKFFEYGRNKNGYFGTNPIDEYLSRNYILKKDKGKDFYPETVTHIPKDIERALHDLIQKNIHDPEIMAVIAPKCFGMSLDEIFDARWSVFQIKEDCIILNVTKNKVAGSIHNFSRPVLFEGEYFLRKIIKNLEEESNAPFEFWKDKKIITLRNTKECKNKKGRLTKYVRDMLIQAGMGPQEISNAAPSEKKFGGSGVALLRKHYKYVLSSRCGLYPDSPEYRFLTGLVPNDVLHGHYRSLSDPISGLPYLCVIVRRDDYFLEERNTDENDSGCVIEHIDGNTVFTIASPGPRKKHVTHLKRFVTAGTVISLSAEYGVRGQTRFVPSNAASTVSMTKRIY